MSHIRSKRLKLLRVFYRRYILDRLVEVVMGVHGKVLKRWWLQPKRASNFSEWQSLLSVQVYPLKPFYLIVQRLGVI